MTAGAPAATDRVLARLLQLHPKKIDLSLGRIERLLAALGNPHQRLPPAIHVAGTNGKGSVVATLRACLEAAGHRVHVYTSPHLVRFHERIRLAGQLVEEDALLALLEECERANQGAPITFFEITTAAAFLAFARVPADIVLLETGLGGRLDATNLLRSPAVTAITPVSLDHQAFLGDTVAAIAGEKAGILRPGVAAVIGPQPDDAAAVIAARAAAIGAPLYRFGLEWYCSPHPPPAGAGGPPSPAMRERVASGAAGEPLSRTAGEGSRGHSPRPGEGGARMRYEGGRWRLDLPLPALAGLHQIANAGTAIACLEQLSGFSLPANAIPQGLRHIDWPARLQRLIRGPLVGILPPGEESAGWELWLDGGHNPAAGAVLAETASLWRDRPLYLIVGMLNTKDSAGFLAPLARHARTLHAVTIPGEENPHPATQIVAAARGAGIAAQESGSVEAALRDIIGGQGPGRVLICGSLHLAGVVLAENS
jgi:dihydrofolate synthase/folylpolyglutamate synthase